MLLLARSDGYTYYGKRAGDVDGDGTAINVRSVWNFKPVGKGGEHGARFPEQLPRRCIQLSTRRGQTVFDPFAGEGNTLIAAKRLGRLYFGCDISPSYVELARKSLALEDLDAGPRQAQPSTALVKRKSSAPRRSSASH